MFLKCIYHIKDHYLKSLFRMIFIFALTIKAAYAVDLLGVYKQALISDPQYQAVYSAYLAATEAYPQARAALLPKLLLSGQFYGEHAHVFQISPTRREQLAGLPVQHSENFTVTEVNLTLTQPIINFSKWFQLGVAKYQVEAASAAYVAQTQSLMIQVATAYFNILQAQQTLKLTLAQKAAIQYELNQAQAKFKAGIGTITSVDNAQTSYDTIVATEIANRNNLKNAIEQLYTMTQTHYKNYAPFKTAFPIIKPTPNIMSHWVTAALSQNFTLQATRLDVEAAKQNINVNATGYYPTLDFVGMADRTRPHPFGFATPQDESQAQAGIQLSFPAYQGGLILSKTRQATDTYQQNEAQLENTYLQTMVSTKQTFNNLIDGISKITADNQAILSANQSIFSTKQSMKAGIRTMVDLLIAYQSYYQNQLTLTTDQYAYIINFLTLKELAGTLNVKDFEAVNGLLAG